MLDQFKNPPAQYRMAPVWFWNITPDVDEVERQVREMHANGIGGFFIVERNGTRETDPSQWRMCLERARAVAGELGMFAGECAQDRITEQILGIEGMMGAPPPTRPPVQPVMLYPDWPDHLTDSFALSDKLDASEAHCAGVKRVLSTPFGSADWGMSLEEMKADISRSAALGITEFRPYGFPYSLPSSWCGTDEVSFFYQSSLWPYFKHLADYTARLCWALSQGKHKAQVALLDPVKALAYEYELDPNSRIARLALDYFAVYCEFLLKEHIDYDVVSDESLTKALALDQHLHIGDEEYGLLIMPPITAMSCAAARKIEEYVDDGGALLANALLPLRDADGDRHDEVSAVFRGLFGLDLSDLRSRVLDGRMHRRPRLSHNCGSLLFYESADAGELVPGLRQTVSLAIKPDVSVRSSGAECRDILYQRRTLEDGDLFFFHNTASKPRHVKVTVRCDKIPHVLDLQNGGSSALAECTLKGSRTVFRYRFEPYESLLIHFSREIVLPAVPRATRDGLEIVLSNTWKFRVEGRNCVSLDNWNANGGTEIVTAFEADCVPNELLLVLERSSAQALRASVNGVHAQVPYGWVLDIGCEAFDITALVKQGVNEIVIANRDTNSQDWSSCDRPVALLMGPFSLDESGTILHEPKSKITSGSWTDQGYPFFSGTACYSQLVEIPAFHNNQRVVLRADNPANVVEFVANGAVAGVRAWAPYEMDITHLVKPGPNSIELKVTNTPANAIARDVRPSGLLQGARLIIY